ncbi:MAG: DEAD/DEAH box helicase [Armatimonas sp.]
MKKQERNKKPQKSLPFGVSPKGAKPTRKSPPPGAPAAPKKVFAPRVGRPQAQEAAVSAPKPRAPKKTPPNAPQPAPTPEPVVAEVRDEPLPGFESLGLSDALLASVKAAGFESPTPIQARAIPVLLEGKDLIGQAQTGTGKTAAFALPLLANIDPEKKVTQALVLVPTRELAIQAAEQLHKLAAGTGLRVVPVYGGQPIDRQFYALRVPPAIVVGTPGRLMDHMRRGSVSLSEVTFCALDEADEMLAFGFIEDIETILAELPEERQTALFSATMPPRIAALSKKFIPDAVKVEIQARQRTVDTIKQVCYEVSPGKKREALARILDMETPGPTIVFCRTRAETQELADSLRLRGYDAEPLHGEMAQAERDRTMKKFKEGQADLLIATDVAARGLDIDTVTHVINFDLPWDVEQYIHRIGRTGRAGRTGDAITLIEPKERRNLRRFEQLIGARIEPMRIPSSADIAARRREVFGAKVMERLSNGDFDDQLATVSELAESYDLADIAAAALTLLWEATSAGVNRDDSLDDELAAEAERPEAGMARLFVSMGRFDKLRPADLVGAILSETGLPPRTVGTIDIMDRVAFVEVPTQHAQRVIDALGQTKLRGRRPKVGFAHPR